MKIALFLFVAVFFAYAAPADAGTKKNPNSTFVLLDNLGSQFGDTILDPPLEFGVCAYAAPRSEKSRNRLDKAYGDAQGDEGINRAFNLELCVHVSGFLLFPISNPVFPWEDLFDADPLPNEISP